MYTVYRHNISPRLRQTHPVPVANFNQRHVAIEVTDFLNLKERNQHIYYRVDTR